MRDPNPASVTNRLPHGALWARGLQLAEAEIGRGPAPAGRWARRNAPAARPDGEWTLEKETWAAQAA